MMPRTPLNQLASHAMLIATIATMVLTSLLALAVVLHDGYGGQVSAAHNALQWVGAAYLTLTLVQIVGISRRKHALMWVIFWLITLLCTCYLGDYYLRTLPGYAAP